jgi:hypothetical protein
MYHARDSGCDCRGSGALADMTVEIPTTGGRIEGQLIPNDDPATPLSVKLGRSGHVVYALAAMLKMGFRIVECTSAERAIMESHGITPTG